MHVATECRNLRRGWREGVEGLGGGLGEVKLGW